MRRLAGLFLGIAAIGAGIVLASASLPGSSSDPTWSRQSRSIHPRVEQQGDVVNPTDCVWDTDDTLIDIGWARLAPGETLEGQECLIADLGHRIAAHACAPKGASRVLLSLSVSVPKGTWTQQTVIDEGCQAVCIVGPAYPNESEYMEPIPNSNGGIGVPTTITAFVQNLGKGKKALSVGLYVSHRNANQWLCGAYPGPQWSSTPQGEVPVIRWAWDE